MKPKPFLMAMLVAAFVSACGGGGMVGSDDGGGGTSDSSVVNVVTSTVPNSTTTITIATPTVQSDSTEPTSTTTTTVPSPTTTRTAAEYPSASSVDQGEVPGGLLDRMLEDASDRLGTEALEVSVAEHVEWPDGALGCPEPGVSYTQAITPGYHIVVSGGGGTLDYRVTLDGAFKICDRPTASPRDGDS